MTTTEFTPTGIEFVHSLLVFAGALAAIAGAAFWMIETNPGKGTESLRRRFGQGWWNLARASWGNVPGCVTGWLVRAFERGVRVFFADADLGVAFSGLVILLLAVLLPGAALVNALIGGSKFLLVYYLLLLAALVYLNFSGETGRFRIFNGLIAAYLGLSLFLVIPVYVARSFTEVTIKYVFSHAVLSSFLVAVFWYLAAYGAWLVFDGAMRLWGRDPTRSAAARFVQQFLAALPVAFVLTFLALLSGHLSVFEQSPFRSWQLVLCSTGLTALSFPATLEILAWGAKRHRGLRLAVAYGLGFMAAAGLSLASVLGIHMGTEGALSWAGAVNVLIGLSADGIRVHLGPDFWVAHLPFVPLKVFFVALVFSGVAKGIIGAFWAWSGGSQTGGGVAYDKPFLASALSCASVAVLVWGVSAFT